MSCADLASFAKRDRDRLMEVRGVCRLLQRLRLEDYAARLITEGYDTVEDIQDLDEEALRACGVKPWHVKRFRRLLKGAPPLAVPIQGRLTLGSLQGKCGLGHVVGCCWKQSNSD